MSRILVIDDDRDWLVYLRKLLEQDGHEVLPLLKPDRLEEIAGSASPELVVTDIMMPGFTGSYVYNLIRQRLGGLVPVIVCSSTRMRVKADDPLLDHVTKSAAHDELNKRIRALLTESESMKQASEASTIVTRPQD